MYKQFAAVLALALSASVSAFATPITAGGNVIPSAFSAAGLTLLATSPAGTAATSSSATFTATYQTGVFSDTNNVYCSGCLDFVYYVVNDFGSPQGTIESISASNFDSFLTSVGYIANPSTTSLNPNDATRSSDGTTLKFYFDPTGLMPGQTASYLVIETNARNFTTGNWSIQDGSALPLTGFQPTAVTPEPGSLVLLGTGLLGAAGAARRRFGF